MKTKAYLLSATLLFSAVNSSAHHEDQQVEHAIKGGEIHAVLAGNTAYLDNGAVQSFNSDGKTLYKAGSGYTEKGSWRIEGDRYCSEWSGRWSCYKMTAGTKGRITWIQGHTRYGARVELGLAFK